MAKRKPWENLYTREGSPFLWVRFTLHAAEGPGQKIRRSTDESDPGAAKEAAKRIYFEERAKAGQAVPPEVRATLRIRIGDAVVEYIRDKLKLVAQQRDAQHERRVTSDLNLFIVPKEPDELAALAEEREARKKLNAKLRKEGKPERPVKPIWQPEWTYVDEITSEAWERTKLRLHWKNKETGSLKWASIRSITWSLRGFLAFAQEKGWIGAVPKIAPPSPDEVAQDQAEYVAMSEEHRDLFLSYLKHQSQTHPEEHRAADFQRAYWHYTLMMLNGFRKSTVERMTRKWIVEGVCRIPAAAYKVKKGITEIELLPPCLEVIEEAVKVRKVKSMDEPIFGSFTHENLFWSAVRKLGIPEEGLSAHHIGRRTAATTLALNGATEAELMAANGWRTPAMAQRYVKNKLGLSRAANRKMPLPKLTTHSEWTVNPSVAQSEK